MKISFITFLFFISNTKINAQIIYLNGQVNDEQDNVLPNVIVSKNDKSLPVKSSQTGTFKINLGNFPDTIYFQLQGFQSERKIIWDKSYVTVKLKKLSSANSVIHHPLSSHIKNLEKEEKLNWLTGNETYATLIENRFVETSKSPDVGISLNMDVASYSNIRRFINFSSIVPPDAVRIEEMLNYFNLDYTAPKQDEVFNIKSTAVICPWNKKNGLLFINLSAQKIPLPQLPPSNIVLLIDISASMDLPNRLPLLQYGFKTLVKNLREQDSISIVVYGGITGLYLPTTSGIEKEKIIKAIDGLTPGGSTPGESGIKIAYEVAKQHFLLNGNNRIILATDGDFNVGVKDEKELIELISKQRETGIYLTCLGVGMGNFKDSKIQTLAAHGNGNYAYLDTYPEAERVLVKEFTQTLFAAADETFLKITFDTSEIKQYRLIGYDNRWSAFKDSFAKVEGGEIGSGQGILAMVEIALTNSTTFSTKNIQIGNLELQYILPGKNKKFQIINKQLNEHFLTFDQLPSPYQFATSIVLYGTMLKHSIYSKNINWPMVYTYAKQSADITNILQNEYLTILQKTMELYDKKKSKKFFRHIQNH